MPDLTFAEAADWFAGAAGDLDDGYREAERRTAADLKKTAERLSSGPLSTAQLRKAGHPYAKRHASPLLNPGVINVQSDKFRQAWEVDGPNAEGETTLANTDPKAALLESGTKTMVARPIDALIEEQVAPRRENRLEVALENVLRDRG